jgi:hypothetical protein
MQDKLFIKLFCALSSSVIIIVALSAQTSIPPKAGAEQKTTVSPSTPPLVPVLSELSKLKAENFQLRTQLTQCTVDRIGLTAQIQSSQLTSQQSILETAFKKELHCSDKDKFDWSNLTCMSSK